MLIKGIHLAFLRKCQVFNTIIKHSPTYKIIYHIDGLPAKRLFKRISKS